MSFYDKDITEGIPYTLSNPSGATTYVNNAEAYDFAINGIPFFLATSDEFPYRRQTAQYRKQQIDQSNEPGEQSITGWWVRSQVSFHSGTGIKYYDPATTDQPGQYRFKDSKGLDVWTKGLVKLLYDVNVGHEVTGNIASNGVSQQQLRSIKWSNTEGVLSHDEYDVDKVFDPITSSVTFNERTTTVAKLTTSTAHKFEVGMQIVVTGCNAALNGTWTVTSIPTTTTLTFSTVTTGTIAPTAVTGSVTSNVIHFIDYNAGAGVSPVYAICDDGTKAYWVTNTATKKIVYSKPLTGNSSNIADQATIFDEIGLITNATMEYVKERIVMCANNKVYEFSPSATLIPSPIYTHPSINHVYTSITASGPAIYISGYNGIQSSIIKFTLSTSGAMPTLSGGATIAAEFPTGEVVHKIFYYLGYMMIGTNKGVRAATVSDQDGSISYGPLIVETSQPCYDFAARDKYIWCATGVDGSPGVVRIDLSNELEPLRFAYANDIYYYPETESLRVTGHSTTSCAFLDGSDRLAFSTNYNNGASGAVYIQDPSRLVYTGSLTTGAIRYGTLENKVFKTLKTRINNASGGLIVESIDSVNNSYVIGTFSQNDFTPEIGISYPTGAQEYMSFRFTLTRSTTSLTEGPLFNGYQLKALPAITKQRLIQYPLACYDREMDTFGIQVGYEGASFIKMEELEAIENIGDTIRIEDFRNDESYLGLIEEMQFINRTPTDKRFSGFGGVLLLTIRTI